jgi:hypothetical protein
LEPFWIRAILAVAGLGVPKALLDHYARNRLPDLARWLVSIAVLLVLILVRNAYISYIERPRQVTAKQHLQLVDSLARGPDVSGDIKLFGYDSCTDCPAYTWQLARAMNDVHDKRNRWKNVIVPYFTTNGMDVRLHGIMIRGVDKRHPPESGKAILKAFEVARIPCHLVEYNSPMPSEVQQVTQIEVMSK